MGLRRVVFRWHGLRGRFLVLDGPSTRCFAPCSGLAGELVAHAVYGDDVGRLGGPVFDFLA